MKGRPGKSRRQPPPEIIRHGGRRAGAGRPKLPPKAVRPPVPWLKVRELAMSGCPRDEIAAELEISDELLRDPEIRVRMDLEVKRGFARLRVSLRKLVIRLSSGRQKGASVMALLSLLRNTLDWDRARARDEPGRLLLEAGSTGIEKLRGLLDKVKKRRAP